MQLLLWHQRSGRGGLLTELAEGCWMMILGTFLERVQMGTNLQSRQWSRAGGSNRWGKKPASKGELTDCVMDLQLDPLCFWLPPSL